MFKNYFKTAWRNLLKDKQFSLLNLLGLSTGLACVLLIYLWVSDELSVDKFNANDSQLYQVMKTSPTADGGVAKFNNCLEFNYSFLDDDYNKLYASEQRVAVLSKYFAAIAILISCLGLFGLAAFTAQKRQKEIGIRKVIGASVSDVIAMLSKGFLILVNINSDSTFMVVNE